MSNPFPSLMYGRLLVTGSRSWSEDWLIERHLRQAWEAGYRYLAHGACKGVDMLAHNQACRIGFTINVYPVDHAIDGPWPGAGPLRNARMIQTFMPHVALSFRSPGKSKGTDGCVRLLEDRKILVVRGSGL